MSAIYNPFTGRLSNLEFLLTRPEVPQLKQARVNSKDIISAKQLMEKAYEFTAGALAIFVEVPVGSQSARAMASYGICIGVLGALQAMHRPFIEVTPIEVKMEAVGSKTATKEDMIQWAIDKYPTAPWPVHTVKGVSTVSVGQAEHLADAVAAIHAGLKTAQFHQLSLLLQSLNA